MNNFPPETQETIRRITQLIAEREAEAPPPPIHCRNCSDTGYVVTVDFHHGMNQNYLVGRPCESCTSGQRIASRVAKEKGLASALAKMSPTKRRKMTVEKLKKDVEDGYRDADGIEQF